MEEMTVEAELETDTRPCMSEILLAGNVAYYCVSDHGHVGLHQFCGRLSSGQPYSIEWNGDSRKECALCNTRLTIKEKKYSCCLDVLCYTCKNIHEFSRHRNGCGLDEDY